MMLLTKHSATLHRIGLHYTFDTYPRALPAKYDVHQLHPFIHPLIHPMIRLSCGLLVMYDMA